MRSPRLFLVIFIINVSIITIASAQQEQEPAPTADASEQQPANEFSLDVDQVPDTIELTDGSGFSYNSAGRRDPFVSLAQGFEVLSPDVRPPGLRGMLIQEVTLRGIVKTEVGYIAMIQGTDNKSYFAKLGERLYDGTISKISDTNVIFRQEINDPLRVEKFQNVEKSLYPVEETRR